VEEWLEVVTTTELVDKVGFEDVLEMVFVDNVEPSEVTLPDELELELFSDDVEETLGVVLGTPELVDV